MLAEGVNRLRFGMAGTNTAQTVCQSRPQVSNSTEAGEAFAKTSESLGEVTPARFERSTCGLGMGPEPQSNELQNVSTRVFPLKRKRETGATTLSQASADGCPVLRGDRAGTDFARPLLQLGDPRAGGAGIGAVLQATKQFVRYSGALPDA